MSQKATVQSVSVKTGTNEKGEWVNTQITTIDGARLGTFEHSAAKLNEGDEFEFEAEVGKGGKLNIKSGTFKLLKASNRVSPNGKEGPYKRDTEGIAFEYQLKAQMQEVDRVSIESQSVWKGIVEILTRPGEVKLLAEAQKDLDALIRKALAWAEARFDAKPAPTLKTAPKEDSKPAPVSEEPEKVDPLQPFKNVGQFLQWCIDDHGLTRTQVLEIVGCKASELSNLDLIHAHGAVEDWLKINKPEGKTEEPELPF